MKKITGIINLHTNVKYQEVMKETLVIAVNFLGRFSIIDFVLSNMSNSEIENVAILIQENPNYLFQYLQNDNPWYFNAKSKGIALLYNEKYSHYFEYNHDINNLTHNKEYIIQSESEYFVIAPAHVITTIDYRKVVAYHEQQGAEITIVYQEVDSVKDSYMGQQILTVEEGIIKKISTNVGYLDMCNISLETYVFTKKALLQFIEDAQKISSFFSIKDMLGYLCNEKVIHSYRYYGYARRMDSMQSYYKYSLELLDHALYSKVFTTKWPIHTITNTIPPAKYLQNSNVKKSLIANGCIIDGTVENSIIGHNVSIGKNAHIRNSIILTETKIADEAVLDHVIIDKQASIEKQTKVKGTKESPLYIKKGDVV